MQQWRNLKAVNSKKRLVIIGAGGHGKVVADCAESMGIFDQTIFLDGSFPERKLIVDWQIVDVAENFFSYINQGTFFFVAIGNNDARRIWLEKLNKAGAQITTLIHPNAVVSARAVVSKGTLILAGAVVNILAYIGKGCIINTATTVDHDCKIGDFSHLAPGTHFAGTITTGQKVFFGVGCSVIPNLNIGDEVIVGAGSTVIEDLPDRVTAVGSPAKIIKRHAVKTEVT